MLRTLLISRRAASEIAKKWMHCPRPLWKRVSKWRTRSGGCHSGCSTTDRSWTVATVGTSQGEGMKLGSWYRSKRPGRAGRGEEERHSARQQGRRLGRAAEQVAQAVHPDSGARVDLAGFGQLAQAE